MAFKVTTEPRDHRQLALTVEVDQARVDQELRKAARKAAQNYRIPGFRPGKAPYHIIVQQVGLPNLYREFVDDLAEEVYKSGLEQAEIQPYAQAALEDIKLEPLTYTLVVPLDPEIKLGEYRSLRVEEEAPQVDEAQIDARLETMREQKAGWMEVARPSAYGDMLNIDVKSVVEPVEGAEKDTETGEATVVLDESDWDVTPDQENPMEPPGFDAALLEMNAGEEKEFVLSWPADSQSIYAGKHARFHVKLNGIKAHEKPALDDAFAQGVNPDFATLDDLKTDMRANLLKQSTAQAENSYAEKALDAVLEVSTLDYPPVVIEDQIESMVGEFDRQLRQFGIDGVENYLKQAKQSLEDYRERLRPEATKLAERNLILSEILRTEALQVSDEEFEARVITMLGGEEAAQSEASQPLAAQLRSGGRPILESQILREKALDRLLAIVRGQEVPELGATPAPSVEVEDERRAQRAPANDEQSSSSEPSAELNGEPEAEATLDAALPTETMTEQSAGELSEPDTSSAATEESNANTTQTDK